MNWPGYRPNSRRSRRFAPCEPVSSYPGVHAGRKSVRNGALATLLILINALAAHGFQKTPGNLIYHPSLGFQIPFEIDPADKPFLKSIELYVSSDQGRSWRLSTATTPSSKSFKFRAVSDGEYWFAVRTLDVEGRYNPGDDKPIMPDWRVVVDSKKPGLGLRAIGRRGSQASIAWDARDENLDMGTFVLEYSIPGSGEWKPVPITRPSTNGESSWDCGTAEPVRVRATVSDKAGNLQIAETQLGDGAAQHPNLDASQPTDMDRQAPAPIARMASAAGDRRGILGAQDPLATRSNPSEEWIDTPRAYGPESMTPATRGSESGRIPNSASRLAGEAESMPMRDTSPRRQIPILNSPKFPMNYVVDGAGPNGPATVELWVTRDNGKNWSRWAEDDDRVSPMMVDLGGEGTFGLAIVARSIAGQGDEIPRSGTVPQYSVEIDSTPPAMILNVIKVGVGSQSGKVLISWQAEDRNFGTRPIGIFYRPETSNQWLPIVENIENTGQYVWTPGPQVPPIFHVRIEARDTAGNRSSVDTTQYEPVLLDRSRPKGRIVGISIDSIDTASPIGNTNPPAAGLRSEPPIRSNGSETGTAGSSLPKAEASDSKPSARIEPFPTNSPSNEPENPLREANPNTQAAQSSGTTQSPEPRLNAATTPGGKTSNDATTLQPSNPAGQNVTPISENAVGIGQGETRSNNPAEPKPGTSYDKPEIPAAPKASSSPTEPPPLPPSEANHPSPDPMPLSLELPIAP